MLVSFNPTTIKHIRVAEFIRNLGQGTFGKVDLYVCMEKHDNTHVCNQLFVVKRLVPVLNHSIGEYVEQYVAEDKEYILMRSLKHNCIRQIYDIDVSNNCLICEYIEGIDMFSYLYEDKTKSIPNKIRPCLYIFNQLLDSVEYMHSKGIAHKDIKIENMLVNNFGTLKLIDFGLSERYIINGEKMDCIKYQGTMESMSPEISNYRPYDPSKADIWACGIVLYNILYMNYPWEKSRRSDANFNLYMNYCDTDFEHGIPTKIFPRIKKFNDEQFSFISKLFKQMLAIQPSKRASIREIKQTMSKLFKSMNK